MSKLFKAAISLLLAFSLFVVPAWANGVEDEDSPHRIPYLVAVRGALRNLPAVTQFDQAIEDMVELRQTKQDLLEFLRSRGTGAPEEIIQLERQIGDLSANISNMRTTQEIARGATEFSMRNSMTSINNTLLDIQLMEATIAQDMVNLEIAELRLAAGLVSESSVHDLELALQQRESNLAAMRVSLESERQNLNRILQRSVSGYYYVAFQRELIELPANLDEHIRRTAHRQPNVRQRETALGRARAALNSPEVMFGTAERTARERALTQAERERNEAQRSMETEIRNLYNNLTMLLHSNESYEIELQRAAERLEALELNYQAGLATRFEVEAIELSILASQIAIEKNLNNFWNLQFVFENPFIRAMGN